MPVTATVTATTPATARADGVIVERSTQNTSINASSLRQADGTTLAATDSSVAGTGSGRVTTAALLPATLANGLPGATNFVPSNIDPNAAT